MWAATAPEIGTGFRFRAARNPQETIILMRKMTIHQYSLGITPCSDMFRHRKKQTCPKKSSKCFVASVADPRP